MIAVRAMEKILGIAQKRVFKMGEVVVSKVRFPRRRQRELFAEIGFLKQLPRERPLDVEMCFYLGEGANKIFEGLFY